jgi:hypothetical protein
MPSRLALGSKTKASARFDALFRVIVRHSCMIQGLGSGGSSERIGGNPPVSASVGLRGRCLWWERRRWRRFSGAAEASASFEASVSVGWEECRCPWWCECRRRLRLLKKAAQPSASNVTSPMAPRIMIHSRRAESVCHGRNTGSVSGVTWENKSGLMVKALSSRK